MTRLSDVQRRHLSQMVGPDGESVFWIPRGQEIRTAHTLRRAGLLTEADYSYSAAYILTEEGMALVKSFGPGTQAR